jgi:GDP-L-fucose synthase
MTGRIEGQRILVTGGAGFVGRPLCARLEERGAADVVVPRSRDFDLTDPAATARLFAAAQPELVVHLAAEVGGIGANRRNPGRFFYANAMMGVNVVEEARRHGVGKLLVVGTVCSYPKFAPVPFREEDLWGGYPEETNAPYGLAKKSLLVMLQAYREQYGVNGIYLMPVNLYGPGDDFDLENSHVIPALLRKFEEARLVGAEEVQCWGTGRASREFLYVDDCAEALTLALERYDGAEPINVGAAREITIRELAELIAEVTGFEGRIVWDPAQPDGQPRRRLDTSRARELFGFEASTGLREGLRRTLDWYREQRPEPAGERLGLA